MCIKIEEELEIFKKAGERKVTGLAEERIHLFLEGLTSHLHEGNLIQKKISESKFDSDALPRFCWIYLKINDHCIT